MKSLHNIYNQNRRILDLYLEQVDELENQIFDRSMTNLFMDHWANLKRDLSRMDSIILETVVCFAEFFSVCERKFGKHKGKFQDIEEMIGFQKSSVDALKTQLDSIHNHYASIKSDRMNKTLLGLTVISGVFLPLNLIVGFFGMNTPGLFLMDNPEATQWILYLLVGVLAVFLLGFQLIQLLDKWLLRFFLGRFNIYQDLKSRLEDVSKQLKGQ
ncbi:MAG: CorA family divalent cation transporter [Bdellovibrionales bacterium]